MKILLVKWAEKVIGRSVDPDFVHNVTGNYPPLGLLYIASALLEAGYDTQVLDIPAKRLKKSNLKGYFLHESFDMIGFTSTTLLWPQTAAGIRHFRELFPKAFIVLGGPHASLFYRECLDLCELDAVVTGEGESAIVELAGAIESKSTFYSIKGIAYRDSEKGSVKHTGNRELLNIDKIRFPARNLIDTSDYMSIMAKKPFTTMVTSRGCPFKCHFCTQIYWQNKFRLRSADNVISEIEEVLRRFKVKEIMMYDETFLVNRKRVLEIVKGIKDNRLKFKWDIRTRIDSLDEELMSAIREAGCYKVHVGIESGSDRILEKMNKGINTKDIEKTVKNLKKYGFEILGYFMIGYSDESEREINDTIDLSLRLPIDWAHYNITLPAPAVPLFDEAVEKGLISGDYWNRFTLSLGEIEPPPYFKDSGLMPGELEALLKKAYRKFYFRPSRIIGCGKRMLDKDRIWNGLTALVNILR